MPNVRYWSAAVLLSGLLGCARPAVPTAAPVPAPQLIGHAGSGFFTPIHPFNALPPSSRAGIARALAHGAAGVEVDVQLSRDSLLVLYHDVQLANMSTGHGCVSQYTAAELTALHYRGPWPYRWLHDEKVITLDALLSEWAAGPEFPVLHLDLHEADACLPPTDAYRRSPALVRALARTLHRYAVPARHLLIISEYQPTLRQLRRALPGVPLGLEITEQFDERLPAAAVLGTEAVVVPKRLITPERADHIRAIGQQVVVFGGRSRASIERVVGCRPDAVEIDNLRVMQRVLTAQNAARPAARPLEATLRTKSGH
ncbi:hypothetical protein F0P96_12575 [Hymenobacter busanensis]|uniref:Uncharacterized protein n=1 Tax=Hymenobacter busanensis TaxID=2607656 RepID=A0A7L4ZWX7_9BACT|nr:glycerophosphodiester phosphodiesterase [Hymenobacter busanensis]KAA9332308.1 hypothetical protein F0P96_12575 [Hymenobacter busanensis]QHJ07355.1 hypothetical protein GUY19_08700 [Hymenobacter busanensis]